MKVAVTGASGYIAGPIINLLFERGYQVKASVRSLSDPTKTSHLKTLFPSLQLFEADLLKEGSFDEAFKDCDFVIHTASPFQLQVSDPQKDLVDPALKGTLNVLNAVKNSNKKVKRVVITSSCASIINETIPPPEKIWTEEDWNTESTLTKNPYRYSKTLAEKAAWNFQKENPIFELVVINPSFILGPPCSSRIDSTSVKVVSKFFDGSLKQTGAQPSCFSCVDVRDVALGHVNALEIKEAAGHRFILASPEGITHLELIEMLKEDPQFNNYIDQFPDKLSKPIDYRPKFDNSKAKNILRLEFIPMKKTIVDMSRALIDFSIIQKK